MHESPGVTGSKVHFMGGELYILLRGTPLFPLEQRKITMPPVPILSCPIYYLMSI